MLDLKNYELN